MAGMMIGPLRRFAARLRDAKIAHVVQRAAFSRFKVASQLIGQLRGVVTGARHLLGHFSYAFELFLEERLGHNPLQPLAHYTANPVPNETRESHRGFD